MAKVLVTGGTGFIGSQIVAQLLERVHQVAVMSRNPEQARRSVRQGVEVRSGNVDDPTALRSAMTGMDVVINAVQFPNHPVENPRKGYTYMKVDGEGTVRQVQAAQAAGVKRFVYLSGAGTRVGQSYPWFQAKLKAETAVKGSGIPYTIFQPSWVYGPDDRSLNKFVAFARFLPFIPVIGDGRTRVSPVHVEDLARVVADSVEMERAVGQIYEVGGPEELTMDQIIRTMLRVMGKWQPLFHQPVWLMKIVAAPLTLLPTPPLSPAAVDFVMMEEKVETGPLKRDFKIRMRPLHEGLAYLR